MCVSAGEPPGYEACCGGKWIGCVSAGGHRSMRLAVLGSG